MLSSYQCEVIAFDHVDEGMVCIDCVEAHLDNDIYLHRIMRGLDSHDEYEPLIRYTVEERQSYDSWTCDCPNCPDYNTHTSTGSCDRCGQPIVA